MQEGWNVDPMLREDLQRICEKDIVKENLEALRGRSVLITGATGLVGSLLVRTFLAVNERYGLGMRIYPVVRNEAKAAKIYSPAETAGCRFVVADVTEPDFVPKVQAQISADPHSEADPGTGTTAVRTGSNAGRAAEDQTQASGTAGTVDFIFHAAAVTQSKVMVTQPIETIDAAITGTKHLLELAAAAGTTSFVYLSSMEVYGDMSAYGLNGRRATEDRLGYVNPEAVRSDYPESKRMCENLCIAYLTERQVPVRIARLAQTFGAGILPWEKRVFAQFAQAVLDGKDIVLHTAGKSEGNYCYSADCMTGLLTILLLGKAGEAYNVVNEACHTTIAGMAEMVAENFGGGKTQVVFDIPETNTYGYAADTKLFLDGSKLRALGWQPETDLPEMYRRMMASMEWQQGRT